MLSSWSDEDISRLTGMYGLIFKLGDGNPEKAAKKHLDTLQGVSDAIRLTGGMYATDTKQ